MTNAKTEARAIARLEFTCPDCDPDLVEVNLGRYVRFTDHATALAAKDAELAVQIEAKEHARRECDLAEAQLAEARKALEPFALVAEHDIGEDEADSDAFRPMPKPFNHAPQITVGHLRAARRALTGGQEE